MFKMLKQPDSFRRTVVATLLLLSYSVGKKTTEETVTDETTTISDDINCKQPTYVRRPLAPDVRAASPFYVVAVTRTKKTEDIDNVCYTYFEDRDPFLHIISIVYTDGSNSQVVLNKYDIEGQPGIAEAREYYGPCLYHDYTLVPICNQTAFPIYRCYLRGGCCNLDIGPVFGADSRIVLVADPAITTDCAGDIARTLRDTSELSGRQFLFLPYRLPPKCVTTYTTPRGVTLEAIGADRAQATLLQLENQRYFHDI